MNHLLSTMRGRELWIMFGSWFQTILNDFDPNDLLALQPWVLISPVLGLNTPCFCFNPYFQGCSNPLKVDDSVDDSNFWGGIWPPDQSIYPMFAARMWGVESNLDSYHQPSWWLRAGMLIISKKISMRYPYPYISHAFPSWLCITLSK